MHAGLRIGEKLSYPDNIKQIKYIYGPAPEDCIVHWTQSHATGVQHIYWKLWWNPRN